MFSKNEQHYHNTFAMPSQRINSAQRTTLPPAFTYTQIIKVRLQAIGMREDQLELNTGAVTNSSTSIRP
ncbi:hypothetical protein AAC387_Pa09g1087 [Persea americana]